MARTQEPEWLAMLAGPRARTPGTPDGRDGGAAGERGDGTRSEARDLVEAAIVRMGNGRAPGSKPGTG